jgi:hypothetical protein
VTELGKLIAAASRANNRRSMQDAADLATSFGAPISKSHISKNARQLDSITPQLINGVAVGYGIEPEDVIRAALADLGFAIPDYNPSPESAVRRDPDLGVQAKAMLLAALDAARHSLDDTEPADTGLTRIKRSRQQLSVKKSNQSGQEGR